MHVWDLYGCEKWSWVKFIIISQNSSSVSYFIILKDSRLTIIILVKNEHSLKVVKAKIKLVCYLECKRVQDASLSQEHVLALIVFLDIPVECMYLINENDRGCW